MRFNVYRSLPNVAPVLVGSVEAPNNSDGYAEAQRLFGPGPFLLHMTKTPAELTAYLQVNSFVRGQDRIGLMVYRAPCAGKRAKLELAIGADRMHLYDLQPSRKLAQSWDLI